VQFKAVKKINPSPMQCTDILNLFYNYACHSDDSYVTKGYQIFEDHSKEYKNLSAYKLGSSIYIFEKIYTKLK